MIHSMIRFDEKRYPAACVEPPVPKCFLSQLDAQNDVLVLENLNVPGGYRKYPKDQLTDLDHCRVVLRRLAHFHAISTLIQRDSEMPLTDLYPFAIEASAFQRKFWARMARVKRELCRYLLASGKRGFGGAEGSAARADAVVTRHLTDLFWKLVELRAHPADRRLSVLVHGGLDLSNVVFQYDDDPATGAATGGRPICAKFLDFSTLTVSSPVVDISYFLHRAVHPDLTAAHHATLVQHYHRSHAEAIKSFGMHGYEMEMETLLEEYRAKVDYGSMMGCLLKPALYVLQCINSKDGLNVSGSSSNGNGRPNGADDTTTSDSSDGGETAALAGPPEVTVPTESLSIKRDQVPIDLRLHAHLSALARACPCACAVGNGGGSRELALSELTADALAEELARAQAAQRGGLRALDCSNGGTTSTLKKVFLGFISSPAKDAAAAGDKAAADKAAEAEGRTGGREQ